MSADREGDVDVAGGRGDPFDLGSDAQDREPVGDEDEDEKGDRQGHHRCPPGADGPLDLGLDRLDAHFPCELQLSRNPTDRLGPQVETHADDDHHGHHRRPDGVEVETVSLDVGADGDVGEVVDGADHEASSSSWSAAPMVVSPMSGLRNMVTTTLARSAN